MIKHKSRSSFVWLGLVLICGIFAFQSAIALESEPARVAEQYCRRVQLRDCSNLRESNSEIGRPEDKKVINDHFVFRLNQDNLVVGVQGQPKLKSQLRSLEGSSQIKSVPELEMRALEVALLCWGNEFQWSVTHSVYDANWKRALNGPSGEVSLVTRQFQDKKLAGITVTLEFSLLTRELIRVTGSPVFKIVEGEVETDAEQIRSWAMAYSFPPEGNLNRGSSRGRVVSYELMYRADNSVTRSVGTTMLFPTYLVKFEQHNARLFMDARTGRGIIHFENLPALPSE